MSACDKCAEAVEPSDKFCRNCGNPLALQPVVESKPDERRLLTVLFCDLVGSTELASRLDPEEIHELIQLYQSACGQEISRFGGYTAQYLGDGILVYFGYPVATDDAAEQAVRCALAMRNAIERLSDELKNTWGITLALRIGVHTGLVVIGDMGSGDRTERLALGEAPNIAARIQGAAEPDEVLISNETRKLTHGRFTLVDRGAPTLKGVAQPLALYAVQQQATDVLKRGGHTAHIPIRGRDAELTQLDDALDTVDAGGVYSVCIEGEAGSGKSHLLGAFLAAQSLPVVEIYCTEHYNNTPFWPLSAWLEHAAGLNNQPTANWSERLSAFLQERDLPDSLLAGLSSLVGLPLGDAQADAGAVRNATLSALRDVFCGQSCIVVFENLQWADASTREFMNTLVGASTTHAVLVVHTTRSVDRAQSGVSEGALHIELGPIDHASAEAIVRDTVGDRLSDRERQDIIERASGLPMFISELARQTENAGSGVPTSLHSLLLNQLERIEDAKRMAQEAAVLGPEFMRDELVSISLFSDAHFDSRLDTLQKNQVISLAPTVSGAGYRFSHTLMQEVALDSLLRKSRTQIHRRVAVYLQERTHAGVPDRQLTSRLARHWVNAVADRTADAVDIVIAVNHLQASAESSLAISAYEEAGNSAQMIDTLLTRLPSGRERDELKLKVCLTQCVVYCARAEFASPQVEAEVRAAEALCRSLGKQRELAQVLLNLWMMHVSRGNYPASLTAARESLEITQAIQDDTVGTRALAAISNSQFWLGQLDEAYANACCVVEVYTPGSDPKGVVEHGWDAGVQGYMVAVWSSWLLGRTDTLDLLAQMEELTTTLDHPFNRVLLANTAAVLHVMRGDGQATVLANTQQIAVANEFNLAFYKMLGAMFHGIAAVLLGRGEEGFLPADKSFQYYERNLGGLGQSFIAAFMVAVYADQGQIERALDVAEYGLAACEYSGEGVFKFTLERQKRVLSAPPLLDGDQLAVCGSRLADNSALDPGDPRNVWISNADTGVVSNVTPTESVS